MTSQKCITCNIFYGTSENKDMCSRCYINFCRKQGIKLPKVSNIKFGIDDIFNDIMTGVSNPKKWKTQMLLNGSKDPKSLLYNLPGDVLSLIHKFMHIEHEDSIFISLTEIKFLKKILQNADSTHIDFLNALIDLNILELTMSVTSHYSDCNLQSFHLIPHMIDNNMVYLVSNSLKFTPLRLLTAEQANDLAFAKENDDLKDKLWIWLHLIYCMVGDYWNIDNTYGVANCYYNRTAPSLINKEGELESFIFKQNKISLFNSIVGRGKNALQQCTYAYNTQMYFSKNPLLKIKLLNLRQQNLKTSFINPIKSGIL